MKMLAFVIVLSVASSYAATRYVALNGGNVAPYTNWATAARSVHDAINIAVAGDTVMLSNGVYYLSATVQLNKGITLTSLNGASYTTLNGSNSVRVVSMDSNNAYLRRLTITKGYADNWAGVICMNGTVDQCVIASNSCDQGGGGVWLANSATVQNSLICYNSAPRGGGFFTDGGIIINCTITRNTGAGLWWRTGATRVINSIIYDNVGGNIIAEGGGSFECKYSCSSPLPGGQGNISNNPLFVNATNDVHLALASSCRNTGTNLPELIGATDLEGSPRIIGGKVDMGAYEFNNSGLVITSLSTIVSYATTLRAIAGTNDGCVGMLWVSNAANGAVDSMAATPDWTSPEIALEVGANLITVYGTDTVGTVASDAITITRKAATPTGLAASDGTFTNKVALAWLAAPGAASYRVLRAVTNDSGSATTIAATVTNTVYDDTSAAFGQLYYYWLLARQNGVEGDASAPDSGYRQLQASTSIAATLGISTNAVAVHWKSVQGATKYRVYRADSPLTNLASAIATDVTTTNCTDTSAVPGIVYYYWVRAESAVAAGAWCGPTPGYALLAANFADKKTWAMRDTKKMDTLICKQLPGPWSALFNASWSVAIVNARTGEPISGPFELVTKNGKIWTLKNTQAVITYTERYNKRKDTYKTKLTYKFAGNMPTQPGVYLHMPTGLKIITNQ